MDARASLGPVDIPVAAATLPRTANKTQVFDGRGGVCLAPLDPFVRL